MLAVDKNLVAKSVEHKIYVDQTGEGNQRVDETNGNRKGKQREKYGARGTLIPDYALEIKKETEQNVRPTEADNDDIKTASAPQKTAEQQAARGKRICDEEPGAQRNSRTIPGNGPRRNRSGRAQSSPAESREAAMRLSAAHRHAVSRTSILAAYSRT